jgi:hypothetical protein
MVWLFGVAPFFEMVSELHFSFNSSLENNYEAEMIGRGLNILRL